MNNNLNSHYICSLTEFYINYQKTPQGFPHENVENIKPYYSSLKQDSQCCTRLCY